MMMVLLKLHHFLLFVLVENCLAQASTSQKSQTEATMLGRLTSGYVPEEGEPVKHQTTLGIIEGKREASVGSQPVVQKYYAFRGIPYAHPPVGELRFSDPVDAVEAWPNNYLDASRYGSVCLQFDQTSKQVVGQEACLFLNIFTPALPGTTAKGHDAALPVLVFIHGGGYLRASSSVFSGGRLASQNIVLVTINYRLGALGFFSTGDKVIPGNFGLLDQVSALRWVKRYIAEFGGDPNRITVAGFSAGSASVHTHMLSPVTKDLFQGTIMVSGTAFAPWNIQKDISLNVRLFAAKVKCPSTPSADMKSCLAKKTAEEILRAQASLMRYEFWPLPFSPVVDAGYRENPYLPAPMRELSPHTRLPVLISMVPQESIVFSLTTIMLSKEPGSAPAVYEQVVRDTISSFWFNQENAELVGRLAENFYYTDQAKSSLVSLFEQLEEILTDFLFSAWVWEAAAKLADAGCPVHAYMMTQRDPETPVWASPVYERAKTYLKIESLAMDVGISHGDDLALVFSPTTLKKPMEETIARLLVSNWANFVAKGVPSISEREWPAIKSGGPVLYYNISESPHMSRSPFRQKETNFWLKTIPFVEEVLATAKSQQNGPGLKPWIVGAIVTYLILLFINRRN